MTVRYTSVEVLGNHVEVARSTSDAFSGTTLVFLHEGLGSARQWRDFPERVGEATRLSTAAYSRLGYGASDPVTLPRPLTYMQDEAITFLPRVLDALEVDEVILVGHSDGGSIALVHAAIDGGARVRAIVLEAPHVFVEDVSVASIEKARQAYEKGDLRAKLAKHQRANVDIAFHGWNDAWLDPAFRAWNIEDYLPRIEVPVLVLQGEDDPYGTRAQVDAIASKVRGPVETWMLPRCGHSPHRDQPEVAHDKMVSFIRRVVLAPE